MKYICCTCMLGIEEAEYKQFSEHSEITGALMDAFHDPISNRFLIDHGYRLTSKKKAEQLMYSVITKEGGI